MSKILLIITLIVVMVSCDNAPEDTTGDAPFVEGAGSIANNGSFYILPVSESQFEKWNAGSQAGWPELMQAASKEFYKEMEDAFDFLFFVVDNKVLPSGAPYGSQLQVKNTVDGLGLLKFDETSLYGSNGRLQSAITLWEIDNLIAILHEMGHRWFNFALDTVNPSHWSSRVGGIPNAAEGEGGIFQAGWNKFADIELYLMGLIPASEVTQYTDMLDEIVTKHGARSPAFGEAQTDFRGAVIVITPNTDMSESDIQTLSTTIENIEDETPVSGTVNWHDQTGGRGNLDLSGLNAYIKK